MGKEEETASLCGQICKPGPGSQYFIPFKQLSFDKSANKNLRDNFRRRPGNRLLQESGESE